MTNAVERRNSKQNVLKTKPQNQRTDPHFKDRSWKLSIHVYNNKVRSGIWWKSEENSKEIWRNWLQNDVPPHFSSAFKNFFKYHQPIQAWVKFERNQQDKSESWWLTRCRWNSVIIVKVMRNLTTLVTLRQLTLWAKVDESKWRVGSELAVLNKFIKYEECAYGIRYFYEKVESDFELVLVNVIVA